MSQNIKQLQEPNSVIMLPLYKDTTDWPLGIKAFTSHLGTVIPKQAGETPWV